MSTPGSSDRPPDTGTAALTTRLASLLQQGLEGASSWRSRERLLGLMTLVALVGGGLLICAEFLDLFEIEARDLVVKEQAGGPHHAYAMLVVGAATIGATLLARSTEQWPPALGIALLGGFAIAFALIGDLPDATRSDLVRGARIAEAHPAIGFWMELAGATIALLSGLALVRLLRRSTQPRGVGDNDVIRDAGTNTP